MELTSGTSLFGNKTRTRVLLVLRLLEESHAAELARILGTTPSNIQKAVDSLERVGVVSGRVSGRERRIQLNPRYFAIKEVQALLDKLIEGSPQMVEELSELRRRPRRSGKAL